MRAGRVLCGRYAVGEVIGRGGMADVRLGHDIASGGWVAIKSLRPELAGDPLFRSTLRREAQTMARLRHAAIVAIHDVGVDDGSEGSGTRGSPFIVMEHVDGWSLRDLLRMGGLALGKAVEYQLGVLTALGASHRAGVVHCDIKPANVMVTSRGAVKMVDFGIACAGRDAAGTITRLHPLIGTPAYLSPEQVRGEAADARSDLYSAGCLLFEVLTGRPPFAGDDPVAVAYQHVHEPVPRAGTGVPALDSVLTTALAKARDDRFQSAHAFRDALRSATRCIAAQDTPEGRGSSSMGHITVGDENSTPIEHPDHVEIEDAPHGLLWKHASEVNDVLLRFLR